MDEDEARADIATWTDLARVGEEPDHNLITVPGTHREWAYLI